MSDPFGALGTFVTVAVVAPEPTRTDDEPVTLTTYPVGEPDAAVHVTITLLDIVELTVALEIVGAPGRPASVELGKVPVPPRAVPGCMGEGEFPGSPAMACALVRVVVVTCCVSER